MTKTEHYMAPTGTSNEGENSIRESVYNRQLPGAPVHPIPRLQGPFEESIIESNSGAGKQRTVDIDAQTRRRNLLERAKYERLCGRKWCQMAGERQATNRPIGEDNTHACARIQQRLTAVALDITPFGNLFLKYRLACISWLKDWQYQTRRS